MSTEAVPALVFDDLHLAYRVRGTDREVLRGVSFEVAEGEAYGLVGESGCGKSTAAYAVMRYLARNGRITAGHIKIAGQDVTQMGDEALRQLRAKAVSMVYQDAGQALNPTIRVGPQVIEAFTVLGVGAKEADQRSRAQLAKVQIADPDSVMHRFPHQLSGGMQQRVVIAMALACDPTLLILDEPTTGLDATVEAEVLDLVRGLRAEYGTTVLFISHNLGVIRKMCDRVGVLYAGKLVEEGPAEQVFRDPRHPYTVGLLRCLPRKGAKKTRRLDTISGFLPLLGADLPTCVFVDRCGLADEKCRTEVAPMTDVGEGRTARCHHWERAQTLPHTETGAIVHAYEGDTDPVLALRSVSKTFRQSGHEVHALVDVTLELAPGETLGLVGESGSGKTTLARAVLGIHAPDIGGVVELDGAAMGATFPRRSHEQVQAIQIVFQNPDSALNRRHAVRRILGRALDKLADVRGAEADRRLLELTSSVRLTERHLDMRPSQLSGGLKQRVAIARAFAGDPRVVVCDEPTSALDVSVQAAILNLLADLQRDRGVSYIFISHDLGVVRYLSDRIAVLYLGRLMEVGDAEAVFSGPHHPYTEALLSSVPSIDEEEKARIRLEGEIPSATNPPSGCVFHTRCPRFLGERCRSEEPPLVEVEPGHQMRCHIPIDELRRLQRADDATLTAAHD